MIEMHRNLMRADDAFVYNQQSTMTTFAYCSCYMLLVIEVLKLPCQINTIA